MAYKTTLLEHSKGGYMTKIPQTEALIAMKDLSPKAYQLLIYYYSKSSGWKFDDKEIADALSTTERMIKKYRKELIDLGYLWIIKRNLTVYFIGRQAVWDFKYSPVEEHDKETEETK